MIHDCDWSGDGEFNSGLGELFGVDADEVWNFISVIGSGEPEDTLLKIEVIVSVPFTVVVDGVCNEHRKCFFISRFKTKFRPVFFFFRRE